WDLNNFNRPPTKETLTRESLQNISLSNNEALIAGVSTDNASQILIFDANSGERLVELLGHKNTAIIAGFSQDNSQLITGRFATATDSFGDIRIWDIRPLAGSEVQAYPKLPRAGRITISPDGTTFGVGSIDLPARLYNRATGEVIREFKGSESGVFNIVISPDGQFAMAVGLDDIIRKWDLNTGQLIFEQPGHESGIFGRFMSGTMDLEVAPGGQSFATASSDGFAKLWDSETGELIQEFTDYPGLLNQVEFSVNGNLLIGSGESGDISLITPPSIWVWNVETGEFLRDLGSISRQTWGLESHPVDPFIVAGGWNGDVRAWNYETGEELYRFVAEGGGIIFQLAFSPDGSFLAVSGSGAPAQIRDAYTGELLSVLTDYPMGNLAFTLDNHLIGSTLEGEIREITVFLDDALDLADERITRELTETECLQFFQNVDCVFELTSQ
ncbi:MAG: WD40 repeat domain-containing protein, partial [Chloroflexota bacterium]